MEVVERREGPARVEPRLQGALGAELGGEGGPSALGLGVLGAELRLELPRRDLVRLEEVALLLGVRGEGGVARAAAAGSLRYLRLVSDSLVSSATTAASADWIASAS